MEWVQALGGGNDTLAENISAYDYNSSIISRGHVLDKVETVLPVEVNTSSDSWYTWIIEPPCKSDNMTYRTIEWEPYGMTIHFSPNAPSLDWFFSNQSYP
jgi:hypothetical protein